jgi:hypothetical protein
LAPDSRPRISSESVLPGQHDDRALEAVAAQDLDRFAPVHVGQADIEQHKIDVSVAGLGQRVIGGTGLGELELAVVRQLLGEGLAEVGVVIDDENAAPIHRVTPGHCSVPVS